MKLITYTANGEQSVGAVVGDDNIVVDLTAADRALGRKEKRKSHAFFTDMLSLLGAGPREVGAEDGGGGGDADGGEGQLR